jgi:hypothetical protein
MIYILIIIVILCYGKKSRGQDIEHNHRGLRSHEHEFEFLLFKEKASWKLPILISIQSHECGH